MRLLGRVRARTVAIMAAVLVAGAGIPIVATALPAQAINCAYGDNFYQFHSDLSHNFSATEPAQNGQFLEDVASGGTLFCQTGVLQYPDGTYTEWVQKNTSNCLTFDVAGGNTVKLQTCNEFDSQEWKLTDNLGGEDWGEIVNAYFSQGLAEELYDNGHASTFDNAWCGTGTYPPQPPGCLSLGPAFDWTLFGPYR